MAIVELDIPSEPSQLEMVRDFVTSFCQSDPTPMLDETGIHQLELAVNEAATNIMRHAHRGDAELRIRVEATADIDQVMILLYYSGETFDPASVPLPTFDGSRGGGMGVYLIGKSVDQVRYSQDATGRNCLSLVKYRPQAQPTEDVI